MYRVQSAIPVRHSECDHMANFILKEKGLGKKKWPNTHHKTSFIFYFWLLWPYRLSPFTTKPTRLQRRPVLPLEEPLPEAVGTEDTRPRRREYTGTREGLRDRAVSRHLLKLDRGRRGALLQLPQHPRAPRHGCPLSLPRLGCRGAGLASRRRGAGWSLPAPAPARGRAQTTASPEERHAAALVHSRRRSFPPHLCRETRIAGSHFHDFVAIGISWIRVWFIRTPCGCEEVSSQGQCGVNYILSTPPLLIADYKKYKRGKKIASEIYEWTVYGNKEIYRFPHQLLKRCVPFNSVLI